MDYVNYLHKFHELDKIPKRSKLGLNAKVYRTYIQDLLDYLLSFHARVFPLVDQQQVRLLRSMFCMLLFYFLFVFCVSLCSWLTSWLSVVCGVWVYECMGAGGLVVVVLVAEW